MADHAYDAPGLSALDFLLAVMRDTSLPLHIRTEAARSAAPYVAAPHPASKSPPTMTIQIPSFPSLEFMNDLLYVKRCWELGILPTDLEDTPVEGHA